MECGSDAGGTGPSGVFKKIALVGNPNVGKSLLFMRLTGRYVTVSNYPGTTVEVTRGTMRVGGEEYEVIDTPGINSLVPQSEDERVTRDILIDEKPDIIVQVADAKNVTRTLFVLSQLSEMQRPTVLVLNLIDEARSRGIDIRERVISDVFGIDVVKTVATEGTGVAQLTKLLRHPHTPRNPFQAPSIGDGGSVGSAPVQLLLEWSQYEDAGALAGRLGLNGLVSEALGRHKGLGRSVSRERMAYVEKLAPQMRVESAPSRIRWAELTGRWTREPLTGLPILAAVLAGMYYFVGVLGAGVLVDAIEDGIFGRYLTPLLTAFLEKWVGIQFLTDLVVGKYGLFSVGLTYAFAIVLPVVTTFFLAFGLLEDSGYLPRLAILSDRIFRLMGLNGKAILPMVLGLGCDTMATLTTRILGSRKERMITTLLLALGVPCSAQLGVILGLLGGYSVGALVFFFSVILLQIIIVGTLSGRFLPGKRSDFIFEIPPIRMVQWRNILLKTGVRVKWFLKEAVPLFLAGTVILFTLDKMHLLSGIVRAFEPVVTGLLGLPARTAEVFVMGFLRRDYGAAGLFTMAESGLLTLPQILVSLTVLTLFVPCIANFFVIVKEHGVARALLVVGFITPYAIGVGTVLNFAIRRLGLPF
ncbi:MAG: ferrous iron transport protein B [Acidobacteria bacterium]|nr:ferrous iron transport protein B [Acidobacteriota bacterium]